MTHNLRNLILQLKLHFISNNFIILFLVMHKLQFSSQSELIYSDIVDRIALSIRNRMLEVRAKKSLIKRIHSEQKQKCSSSAQKSQTFFQNPYKLQKRKWSLGEKPTEFQRVGRTFSLQTKNQKVKEFKRTLQKSLQRLKSDKQIEFYNKQKAVKEIRKNTEQIKLQKLEFLKNTKQREAKILRNHLEQYETEKQINKKKCQLEQTYSRWKRKEAKFAKNRNKQILKLARVQG